ncbi:MAG TPA: hypothetical protein VF339_11455 [Gammaproteobacteria bacterium]
MRSALLAAGALAAATVALAQSRLPDVDRFTATTVAMTPADIELRIDVREWSDEAGRSAVVDALAAGSDVASALRELPTLGYVWRGDSGVGYSVKYAHRIHTSSGERITFVTDKRLGAYDFEPWTADGATEGSELEYSVIELMLPENGTGDGTLSLAAEVKLDRENGLVLLETPADAPRLLTDVKLEPKPYWAKGS